MSAVVIGMDPHKRSATIEVMGSDETVLGGGRYGTHTSGYAAMVAAVRHWPERTWAIEVAQRSTSCLSSQLAGEHAGKGRSVGWARIRRRAGVLLRLLPEKV